MSAAELRMKQLTEGKAGAAKPAPSAFFSGRGECLNSRIVPVVVEPPVS